MTVHAFAQPPFRLFNSFAVDHARYGVIDLLTDLQVQWQLAESAQERASVAHALKDLEITITAARDFVSALQDKREQ